MAKGKPARRTPVWPTTVAAARAVQQALRDKVVTHDRLGEIKTVAGIDVGFEKNGTITRAAVVVLDFPGLTLREQVIARRPTRFPYVPGYLSFREIPAVLAAMKKLRIKPDLLLCDGQGLAHPRRFGIACHLGLLLDIPSIGVAKSRLIGTHGEVPDKKGAWAPLVDTPSPSFPLPRSGRGGRAVVRSRALPFTPGEGSEPTALRAHPEIIGAVLRTRAGVKPVYVSAGHRISLATAIDYALRCTTRYRLPETTRHAHRLASAV